MIWEWLTNLQEMVEAERSAVRVTIIRADGSTPRGVGCAMIVGRTAFSGTIGGGALELSALRTARSLLALFAADTEPQWWREVHDFPLGPALGQCCGGFVQLLFERVGEAELCDVPITSSKDMLLVRHIKPGQPWRFATHRKDDEDAWPLEIRGYVRQCLSGTCGRDAALISDWFIEPINVRNQDLFLYGAGHVGRAVTKAFVDLPFEIYWVDTHPERYPPDFPKNVTKLVATDPADAARHAPPGAWHVIMTHSHAIDFDVCHTVMKHCDFGYIGVIASRTKRVRFVKRLREAGIPEAHIEQLQAPIGLARLDGKEPAVIAVSLAADFLLRLQEAGAQRSLPQTERATRAHDRQIAP